MSRRHKISRKASRKQFRKTSGTHRRNVSGAPMRGGIRL